MCAFLDEAVVEVRRRPFPNSLSSLSAASSSNSDGFEKSSIAMTSSSSSYALDLGTS